MRRDQNIILGCIICVSAVLFQNCAGDEPGEERVTAQADVEIVAPTNADKFVVGDPVRVEIAVNHPDLVSDLQLFVADTLYANLELESTTLTIETKGGNVGDIPIYLKYKDGTGREHRDNRAVTFFSDLVPKRKEIEIVKTYVHNSTSYTQGLEFYEGKLYEGTGRTSMSILAEVELQSGNITRSIPIDKELFGEGITILNDTIYQLTYRAGQCMLYDMDFNHITDFHYQGEGWGLCNNGSSLIMSNGSSDIVWRDPKTFKITKTIHVFDNASNVLQLNELELINGDLYANIYTDNKIVQIDTASGKVLSYINCAQLVNAQTAGVDYLNGIAHQDGRIYLTGKLWPTLYEVRIK